MKAYLLFDDNEPKLDWFSLNPPIEIPRPKKKVKKWRWYIPKKKVKKWRWYIVDEDDVTTERYTEEEAKRSFDGYKLTRIEGSDREVAE